MDAVAGELLSRAPAGSARPGGGGGGGGGLSLEELQLAASLMRMCGRPEDMRAFQGYFVRAVQDRQQLGQGWGKVETRKWERKRGKGSNLQSS